MKTYGTNKAFTAIGVGRSRFRTWVDNGYITPLNSASGYGTKAEWTRVNLYYAGLFFRLISLGLKRLGASEVLAKIQRKRVLSSDRLFFERTDNRLSISDMELGDILQKKGGDIIMIDMEHIRSEIDRRLDK